MQRGVNLAVVMVGVVLSVTEVMNREPGGVTRNIQVVGNDFTHLFSTFCYYDLTYLLGVGPGELGPLGLPSLVGAAEPGPPDKLGANWYNNIMTGPQGIMSQTSFAYKGTRPTFADFMTTWFQPYPGSVNIPTLAPFMGDEGSWLSKFLTFFPPYFYEFFIQTAPTGFYSNVQDSSVSGSGRVLPNGDMEIDVVASSSLAGYTTAATPIVMTGFPSVSPTLVARVSPQPFLNASTSTGNPVYSMNLDAWKALPEYTPDNFHGMFSQSLSYSDEQVRNFYVFAPTWVLNTYGNANGSISPFQLLFAQWFDPAGIHRYGYRLNNVELRWWCDPTGAFAQSLHANGQTLDNLVTALSLRPVAYHEPTPNMLIGGVEMELRPDILPGNRFTFIPYRDGVKWTFYIESVSHSINFGGRAVTSLGLSRGLPASIYTSSDLSATGMLTALHTGNAQRINGQYTIGLPAGLGPSLTPVSNTNAIQVISQASPLFGSAR
jgi:hypothetical protein